MLRTAPGDVQNRFQYKYIAEKQSHLAIIPHMLDDNRRLIKEWSLSEIMLIVGRKYIHRSTAIEVFFRDGSSIFLNFQGQKDRDSFTEKISEMAKASLPNLKSVMLDPRKTFEKMKFTKKWKAKQISNFEYLMIVNSMASRSYKDLMQYNVFPWVVCDYEHPALDLNDPKLFRDLSLNMGSLGTESRKKNYQERFSIINPKEEIPRFHFGSHYSSPAIIYQFFLRLYPFTDGAKILQNGKFDIPDRLFISIMDSWKCATEEMADVRELCPEFYSVPEFLINLNKLGTATRKSAALCRLFSFDSAR